MEKFNRILEKKAEITKMSIASIVLDISQITFGMIVIFALTSFIIYKVRGRNGENTSFQPEIKYERHRQAVSHYDHQRRSANVVSYTVATLPGKVTVSSTPAKSRDSFSEVEAPSKSMKNNSRFTIMNNTFERTVEKPRTLNNWS